uniref:Zgc:154054 n=1 Tax=Paramormyrops kingsleyae TaxID=1676925 RepID=A0A3B3SQS8_9TELE
MYQGLLAAEEQAVQISKELSGILDNLRHLNRVENSSMLTGECHAITARDGSSWVRDAQQAAVAGCVMHVSLVLGIPTVKREKQMYLESTLSSLFYDLTPEEHADIVVIVFVAEVCDPSAATLISRERSGLLEVVSPPPSFYPNFNDLKETFGDTRERVKWRTKQNLDFSFLMLYAQSKGSYYVQLEDDIVAKLGYSTTMKNFVSQQTSQDWLVLEFSQLGFIGKMFRASDIPVLVDFILMFYKDKPIDWLLDHFLWVKVCNPEKDVMHCNREKDSVKRQYKPSLFQHVGLHSSLPGKIQNLKDKDFGNQILFKSHRNPHAELTSSLSVYQSHTLQRAYLGVDFFWGLTPAAGDYILISFLQPQTVKGYLFRSGNIETNGDKFYNTTVEVLPSDVRALLISMKSPKFQISAMRLLIHTDSDFWVLLSEVTGLGYGRCTAVFLKSVLIFALSQLSGTKMWIVWGGPRGLV